MKCYQFRLISVTLLLLILLGLLLLIHISTGSWWKAWLAGPVVFIPVCLGWHRAKQKPFLISCAAAITCLMLLGYLFMPFSSGKSSGTNPRLTSHTKLSNNLHVPANCCARFHGGMNDSMHGIGQKKAGAGNFLVLKYFSKQTKSEVFSLHDRSTGN